MVCFEHVRQSHLFTLILSLIEAISNLQTHLSYYLLYISSYFKPYNLLWTF